MSNQSDGSVPASNLQDAKTRMSDNNTDTDDLYEMLLHDHSGKESANIKSRIEIERNLARARLNRGVDADEYKALQSFVVATDAATEVIDTFWTRNFG